MANSDAETITIRELQRLLDADLSHCYWLVWSSRIAAVKVGGRWRVNKASAEDYAKRRAARMHKRQEKERRRAERRARIEESNRRFQELRAGLTGDLGEAASELSRWR
jgi:excisionase family DNA binding protein